MSHWSLSWWHIETNRDNCDQGKLSMNPRKALREQQLGIWTITWKEALRFHRSKI